MIPTLGLEDKGVPELGWHELRLDAVPLTSSPSGVARRGTWRGVEVAAVTLLLERRLHTGSLFFHRAEGGRRPLRLRRREGEGEACVVLGTSEDARGRTVLVCCLHHLERMNAACAMAYDDERAVNGRRVVGEAITSPAKARRREPY
jgi:hypothetical protein